MSKSFKSFLLEAEHHETDYSDFKRVVIAVGRFNPPHRGHKFMLDELRALAIQQDATPMVFIVDAKKYDAKNPLTGEDRKELLEKYMPNYLYQIVHNPGTALVDLKEKEMIPVGAVVGSDRVDSKTGMSAYKRITKSVYGEDAIKHFKDIQLARDPDSSEDISGFSASKAREAALNNELDTFMYITGMDEADAEDTIAKIRKFKSND